MGPLLLGLAGGTEVLAEAAEAYAGGPATEGLNRLRLLWLAARSPWEELEAFAFGPVGGFDPYLDTWPISPEDLKRTFQRGTGQQVAEKPAAAAAAARRVEATRRHV